MCRSSLWGCLEKKFVSEELLESWLEVNIASGYPQQAETDECKGLDATRGWEAECKGEHVDLCLNVKTVFLSGSSSAWPQ